MNRIVPLTVVLALLPTAAPGGGASTDPLDQWGQWRGPSGNGVAPRGDPPVEWSESENVRWKIAIPGKGHSSPIVWGDRIFVTTAIPHGEELQAREEHDDGAHHNSVASRMQRFVVLAVRRSDGKILWERTVRDEQPHEGTHVTGSWASGSAVTDGKLVIASFGSRGLYALDMQGEIVWEKDLGDMLSRHGHGEGSSPALAGNTLVVNWDHQGVSFVVALDKRNGKELWRVARDEITSWSTPLIVEHGGKRQVVVSATGRVRGYDLSDGAVIWECGGLSRNVVASPVAADGHVYVGNSYDWQAMMGIRLSAAKGDITDSDAVVWKRDREAPYVPSPILYDGRLCYLRHNSGILTCLEARSGETIFGPVRLPGIRNVFASPVGAANRIYIVDRDGAGVVLRLGDEPELLARNRLDDSFSASPAVVGDELYLRGERSLYCLARDPEE